MGKVEHGEERFSERGERHDSEQNHFRLPINVYYFVTLIPNFRLIKCTSSCNYHPHCRGSLLILPSPLSDSEFGKDDDGRASCETSKKWCGGGVRVRPSAASCSGVWDGVFLSSLPPTPMPLARFAPPLSLLGICQREVQCPFRARSRARRPPSLLAFLLITIRPSGGAAAATEGSDSVRVFRGTHSPPLTPLQHPTTLEV